MKNCLLKTICLVPFLFCIMITSEAQIEKGMKVLTGAVSYNYYKNSSTNTPPTKNTSSGFSINPQIGFLLNDKFCIGISVPFSNSYATYNNGFSPALKTNFTSYGLAPYARYYKGLSDKFYFFANASIGFGLTNASSKNTAGLAYKGSGYYYSSGLNFGLLYFISPKVALETTLAGVNYYHSGYKVNLYPTVDRSSEFSARLMPNGLSLGLSYYFK